MRQILKVGEVCADPGEKAFGGLKVAELADGSSVKVPVILVNGAKEGPILYTQAACHGYEINGTEAIRRIGMELDPKGMSGGLIAIPIVNVLAARYRRGHTLEQLDSEFGNMNRTWPGNPDGTITERMAYVIFEEAVKKAGCVIDHHTGDKPTVSWVFYYEGAKEQEDLARIYGAEYLVAEKAGTEEWKKKRFYGKLRVVCHEQLGIPSICPELDGHDHLDEEAVQLGVRGIRNVMKHLGMIGGRVELPPKQYIVSNTELGYVKASRGGWFVPEVKVGDRVHKGDVVGRVLSILDGFKEVEVLRAPRDGFVHSLNSSPMVWPGVRAAGVDLIVKEITNS